MISKLVCTFLVLSIFSVILQSEACFWGSGCSKRDCSMSSWLSWSTCSQPCGTGAVQTRSRKVIRAAKCGGSCWSLEQSRPCNTVCPNGGTPVDWGCLCKTGYSGKCCARGKQSFIYSSVCLSVHLVRPIDRSINQSII